MAVTQFGDTSGWEVVTLPDGTDLYTLAGSLASGDVLEWKDTFGTPGVILIEPKRNYLRHLLTR